MQHILKFYVTIECVMQLFQHTRCSSELIVKEHNRLQLIGF